MKVARRTEPIGDAESRERGDALCAWLRDYGARRVDSRAIDERRQIPPHVVLDCGRHGVLGMQVAVADGGLGLRNREVARVLEQAAGIDLGLGTWLLTSLFPGVRPFAAFATGALRERFLPDLAAGRMLAGYAQTEPAAGTHFSAIETVARECDGGGWRLSGRKTWIGNASWAGVLTVMAQDFDAGGRRRGLVALAVPTDRPGVRIGAELPSLGMRGMVQGQIAFDEVEVAPDEVVGTREQGLDVGVDSMSFSRFAIAATCVGSMKRCAQLMLRFSARRSIATGRLLDHPLTTLALSTAVARISLVETLLYAIADELDADREVPVELFAACKVAGSEFLWRTSDRLLQLCGSRGYDEANLVPQILRDARVTRIFEGPSEALVAYLGGQAANPRSELTEALVDTFAAPALAERLADVASGLRTRTLPDGAALPRTWQLDALGRAALWAVLSAAVDRRLSREPSEALAGAGRVAREHLDTALAAAASGDPREAHLVDPLSLEKTIAAYERSIGAVDPSLPGLRDGLDPLLRIRPDEE